MEINYNQIIAEQREELLIIEKQGWVPRDDEGMVNTDSRLVQIITGVRRSGKSTLAHRALQGLPYAYINFDDERLMGLSAVDLDNFLEALYAVYGEFKRLVLDEIQNVDSWHLFVNRLLRNEIKIVVTGSNSKLLSREMATHLTGRYTLVELLPFSFREFLFSKKVESREMVTVKNKGLLFGYFEQYLDNGGFPEIATGEPKRTYITTLFEAIVSHDIIYRYKIRHVRSFREMAFWLVGNYGTEISYNRLKNLFGLGSDNTAKNYIAYLEEAWLFICLPKFSFKKQETLRYRKIYLIDTAFSSIIGGVSTPNKGRQLENIVFLELFRRRLAQNYELFYFKKVIEVDFVLYGNRQVLELIQVSLTLTDPKTRKREIRALMVAAKELNPLKMSIITLNEKQELREEGKTIHVIPVTEWLMETK
jgi:predicted AAA+ superfamily ATPase